MSSELTGYPVSSLGIDMFSELTGLIDSLGVTYMYRARTPAWGREF